MHRPEWIDNTFFRMADFITAQLPQTLPREEQLQQCKIISHRGEHDNKLVFENTIQAFEPLVTNKVWGVELDIRWTKDLIPIVHHDADCSRLFKKPITIASVTAAELRVSIPEIPTLAEVIEKFAKKLHLMVEIKEEHYPEPERQNAILKELFQHLLPCTDYHFISLAPEMFEYITFPPASCFLPIAQLNGKKMKELVFAKNYGGITGHYCFINNAIAASVLEKNAKVGTGFIASRNCLYRELNRGVEWIFSNDAVALMGILKSKI